MTGRKPASFVLLVYRMPPQPTAARVAVWRQLNKAGLVYLQQMVGVFPDDGRLTREVRPILKKIAGAGGEYHLLPLGALPADERAKLVAQFLDQASRHYQEIIENCEVNFVKEIEFETFRKNFTYEEAEEIRTEFEKICTWFERVRERDWFGAPNRQAAQEWLSRCETMLEKFEARVYTRQQPDAADVRSSPRRLRPPGGSARVLASRRGPGRKAGGIRPSSL